MPGTPNPLTNGYVPPPVGPTPQGGGGGGAAAPTGGDVYNLAHTYFNDYGTPAMQELDEQLPYYQNTMDALAGKSVDAGAQAAGNVNATAAASQAAGERYGGMLTDISGAAASQISNAGAAGLQAAQGAAAGLNASGNAARNYGTETGAAAARAGQGVTELGQGIAGQAAGAQGRDITGAQQNALMGLEAQQGPSAAQAQLQSATNRNTQNALAMARSGRGFGGGAAAMGQAADQRVMAQQEGANQSAVLRAQEDAAWRQRQAANIQAAGGLATSQANANDQRESQLYQLGLQGELGGAGLGIQGAQLGLQGYGLEGQALGMGAQTELAGQNLNVNALTNAGQLATSGAQAAGQLELGGLGQAGQLQTNAGQLNLAGLGQGAGIYGQSAGYGLQNMAEQGQIEQAGLGFANQGFQNQYMYDALNSGIAAQNQGQTMQMIGAGVGALGSAAAFMSDRNEKKGIEPTNVTLSDLDEAKSKGTDFGGETDYPTVVIPAEGTAQPIDSGPSDIGKKSGAYREATDTAGGKHWLYNPHEMSSPDGSWVQSDAELNYDPYAQGVGISGPNQIQGAASRDAANAAAGAAAGAKANAANNKTYGALGAGLSSIGRSLQAPGGGSINPVTGQPWYQPGMALSDEREKEAMRTFSETPGYSYDYKDPEAMGATDGRQYGLMAQDLEKTPAGRSVVKKGPDGTKMVDTSRLALVEGAAMNGLLKRIEALEGKRSASKGKAA